MLSVYRELEKMAKKKEIKKKEEKKKKKQQQEMDSDIDHSSSNEDGLLHYNDTFTSTVEPLIKDTSLQGTLFLSHFDTYHVK